MDHVGNGVYIAAIDDIQTADTGDIDCVISTCQDTARDNVSDDTDYRHVPLADDRYSQQRWGGSCSYEAFTEAAETVLSALQDDDCEQVLVHCHSGQNRSPSVTAAARAVHERRPVGDVLTEMQEARRQILPEALMWCHAVRFANSSDEGGDT